MTRTIVHVVASIEAEASGPSYSVPALADAQARAGHHVTIFSLGSGEQTRPSGVLDRRFARARPRRLAASPALAAALRSSPADIVHNHGLWLLPNIAAADAARRIGALFVVSPRGMLAPGALAFSRDKKRLFNILVQGRRLRTAGLFHATSTQEADDIRAFGLAAPIAVAPNGIDIPDPLPERARVGPPTILSLGRVHPKKGLDRLIRAFGAIAGDAPDWRLVIAGPDEGSHTGELQRLAARLRVPRVDFVGPVYGAEKWRLYASARVFALPTLSENFAMSVAEALAAGTPVISSRGAPWADLERHGCGWWIDHGPEPMAAALRTAIALPPARLEEMGARGQTWMRADFGWDMIAARLDAAYRDVSGA